MIKIDADSKAGDLEKLREKGAEKAFRLWAVRARVQELPFHRPWVAG